MKKILLLLLMLPCFFACSNDDNEKGGLDYLVGTKWSGVNNKVEVSLWFTKENGASLSYKGLSGSDWYDYYSKNGKIHLKPQKYGYYDFDCTISGKTMIVVNSETGKITYTLYKE